MGNGESIFSERQIEEYKKLTYLSGPEIIHCFKKFRSLDEEKVKIDINVALPREVIYKMPELAVNPLKDRIVKVFSRNEDGSMCFEDFLNMMSVFSESAPDSVKCYYAFEIYDFANRKVLHREDIEKLICRLIGSENPINKNDMRLLVDKIFEEADIDENGEISLDEV